MKATIKIELRKDYANQKRKTSCLFALHCYANFKFLIGLTVDKEMISKNPYDKFEIKKNIKAQNDDVLTKGELKKLQKVYNENRY